MVIFIDIETLPDQSDDALTGIAKTIKHPAAMKKQETIDAWHNGLGKYAGEKEKAINDKWLKTSFDGSFGKICCICMIVGDEKYSFMINETTTSEKVLLEGFWFAVKSHTEKPYFVAHNAKFDLPFLWKRSIINGVKPLKLFDPYGRNKLDHCCTMESWEGFNGRIKLDTLAKILGVGSKTEGIDGSQVWPEFKKGNYKKIAKYCMDDTELVERIYKKLSI